MLFVIQILAILFMCTAVFVAIWGFIILTQISAQLKYRNYLMEKLTQYVFMLSNKKDAD